MLLGKTAQGDRRTVTITVTDAPDISGAIIDGVKRNRVTNVTSALDGTFAVTSASTFTWTRGEADTGTPGTFDVQFRITVSGVPYLTLPATWTVVRSPLLLPLAEESITLVGVTPGQAAWLAAATAGGELGSAAYASTGDFDTAGSAAIVANNLSTHIGLTTTAHGGILPQNASIVEVSMSRYLVASDAGKILECTSPVILMLGDTLDRGFQCVVVNCSTGGVDLDVEVTLLSKNGAASLVTQYAAATLYHRGDGVWVAFGDLE